MTKKVKRIINKQIKNMKILLKKRQQYFLTFKKFISFQNDYIIPKLVDLKYCKYKY